MKKRIKETLIFVSTVTVISRVIAPFLMLVNCSILAKPEIYNLFTYVR